MITIPLFQAILLAIIFIVVLISALYLRLENQRKSEFLRKWENLMMRAVRTRDAKLNLNGQIWRVSMEPAKAGAGAGANDETRMRNDES